MATMKVGVYRKYHGPIPNDDSGKAAAKEPVAREAGIPWAVRWFGLGWDIGTARAFQPERRRFVSQKRLKRRFVSEDQILLVRSPLSVFSRSTARR